jgi:2'-5' RNA ligase
MNSEMVRAFIAVPASDEVRHLVKDVVGSLRWAGADVKWVEPENVHFTVKFLGNISQEDAQKLGRALSESLRDTGGFDVTIVKAGTFPGGTKAPRVVWLGLGEGFETLKDVALKVEDACAGLGFGRETRPFKAHLTIGRVRRGSSGLSELAGAVAQVEFKPLKLKVDRVNLTRSRLSPRGPTYTVIESIALRDAKGGVG